MSMAGRAKYWQVSISQINFIRAHLIANLPHIEVNTQDSISSSALNHGGTSIFCKAHIKATHTYTNKSLYRITVQRMHAHTSRAEKQRRL
jgi:hypothetical protein